MMTRLIMPKLTWLLFGVSWLFASLCLADDWPQWLGPQRDSVWREEGIIQAIPPEGLPVAWRVPVSGGYSGPAVADGRVFVTDYVIEAGEVINNPGGRTKLEGKERVLCFDARRGTLLWEHAYEQDYNVSYAIGPRATPTVHQGKVYTLGAEGKLLCLAAADGRLIWQKDLPKEYPMETPIWGFCGHPLVYGQKLICLVGGEGSVAVAFDKDSGQEVWRALSAAEPGYCPPTLIHAAGVDQVLIWHAESLNSLNPDTGEVYWSQPLKPSYGMAITAPRQHGDLLYASSIGNVSALFRLAQDRPAAEVVWRGDSHSSVYGSNSTPMIDQQTIYGADCQLGALRAVNLADGKRLWETFQPTTGGTRRASHGTAFLVKHRDRYFLFSETGDLILARLTPEAYEELGRFHVLEPTGEVFGRSAVWSHPAFAERCLFARNDKELVCVSLAE